VLLIVGLVASSQMTAWEVHGAADHSAPQPATIGE
jgi:hypothetical protein